MSRHLKPHARRNAILAWITAHPGTCFRATCRATGIAQGCLQHHLRLLKRAGLVVETGFSTRRLFFPAGQAVPPPAAAALLQERPVMVLREWLAGRPPVAQHEVLDAMEALQGWSRSTTQHRLERLVKAGLATKTRQGRCLFYKEARAAAGEAPMAALRVPVPLDPVHTKAHPSPVLATGGVVSSLEVAA